MTSATYPNGDPVPAWAAAVGRLQGLGLLSVAAYQHPRAGAPTRAFCRRMRNVERRARGYGLVALADRARILRGGAGRFGFRGATDTWMGAVSKTLDQWIGIVLGGLCCGRERCALRRGVFLANLIRRAFADLSAGRTGV